MSNPPTTGSPRPRAPEKPGDAAANRSPDRSGALVDERYRLLRRIGVGGMGAVYLAERAQGGFSSASPDGRGEQVALKLLHPAMGRVEEVARRFEREAQSARRLESRHIVKVFDFGRTDEGELYLAMELLDGEPLAALLGRGPLAPSRAVRILRQVLDGLDHAHAQGVVHRDLKPDNIMLTRAPDDSDGEVAKIFDFGVAQVREASSAVPAGRRLTQAGMVVGTPHYMSPEQATGVDIDHRSDVYACGVILYEMLAGRRPFEGGNAMAVIAKHVTEEAPPLGVGGVPRGLEKAMRRAIAKKRDKRFQSAAELSAALLPFAVAGAPEQQAAIDQPASRGQAQGLLAVGAAPTRRQLAALALLGAAIGAVVLVVLLYCIAQFSGDPGDLRR